MALIPLTRGQFVTLTIGTWTKEAMVCLASENSISLAVMFDGAAPLHGGETLALGFLALLYDETRQAYHDIVTGTTVGVQLRAGAARPPSPGA